jgi:membrane associated rhomboid family serine protease
LGSSCHDADTVIPLRDTIASSTVPFVTHGLVALNVAVFLYQQSLGLDVEHFIHTHGIVPSRFVASSWGDLGPLLTSMFLHGGWAHLLGNMLYLHIFGDNVEDRVGHLRFFLMYLLAGITAGVAQIMINPAADVPMVGASGAIAGVTGAYLLFYPRARVITLVPIFLFVQIVEIPAFFFLLFWFAFQLLLGVGSLGSTTVGGIAFWAHIGGFVAGMVLGPLLAPRRTPRPAW